MELEAAFAASKRAEGGQNVELKASRVQQDTLGSRCCFCKAPGKLWVAKLLLFRGRFLIPVRRRPVFVSPLLLLDPGIYPAVIPASLELACLLTKALLMSFSSTCIFTKVMSVLLRLLSTNALIDDPFAPARPIEGLQFQRGMLEPHSGF